MGPISEAALSVKIPGGPDEGASWVGEVELDTVDRMFSPFLPLSELPLITEPSTGITPKTCARRIKKSLETNVFATVHCPAWLAGWIKGAAALVIFNYQECDNLNMHALEGGFMCQCEILFILAMMNALGFEKTQVSRGPSSHSYFWKISRPDAPPYVVTLTVHRDAHKIQLTQMAQTLTPSKNEAAKPNLARVAVISAPMSIYDMTPCQSCLAAPRVDEVLNQKLVIALDKVEELVETMGWYDENKAEWMVALNGEFEKFGCSHVLS